MKKTSRILVVCSTMMVVGHATASDKAQLILEPAESSEYVFYTSVPLIITTRPDWLTTASIDSIADRPIEEQYNLSRSSVSDKVQFSLNRAFTEADPSAKVGHFGLSFAFASGEGSEEYFPGGPGFFKSITALGGALVVDYSFNENYRLALIHIQYDYIDNGVSIGSGSNTGLYAGLTF